MISLRQTPHGRILQARPDGVTDYIDADGNLARVQDVTAIVRRNGFERNASSSRCGFRVAPTFRKVASIPVAVADIAKSQGLDILNDPDDMRRFLNHRDNLAFRTTTERV